MDKHEKAIEKSKELLKEEILGEGEHDTKRYKNYRRAVFVYTGAREAAIGAEAPVIPAEWGEREEDFKEQFLKVIERQCGPQRSNSPEELHGSWMQAYLDRGWVYGDKYSQSLRSHPDLVPYADLGKLEQDKDAVFIALCEIARVYIRNEEYEALLDSEEEDES